MAATHRLGFFFDRAFPAAAVVPFARALEAHGVDELWVIEDCFFTSAVPLAAAALTATEHLTVGLGILPAVVRNPAMTAMEIATLCDLAPGRLIAGIGHGEQTWMGQIGARTPSPVTTLEEVVTVVRQLLAGERVTFDGRHVHLDGVQLDRPPDPAPKVLAGVRGPRSLAMAGRTADGVVLAEATGPTALREALAAAAPDGPFEVVVLAPTCVAADRAQAYAAMAPLVAGLLAKPSASLLAHPYVAEMQAAHARDGLDALIRMPSDWWAELGLVGTLDDVLEQRAALHAAGSATVACLPVGDLDNAYRQLAAIAG